MAKVPYRLIGRPVGLPQLPTEETLKQLGIDLRTTSIGKTLPLDLTTEQQERAISAGILARIPPAEYQAEQQPTAQRGRGVSKRRT